MLEFLAGLWLLYPKAACLVAVGFYLLAGWVIVKAQRRANRRRWGR